MTNNTNTHQHSPTFSWEDPRTFKAGEYQRNLEPRRVKRMAENFNVMAFGVAVVARRNGELYVMDAMHRSAAAVQKGITRVPTLIYDNVTPAQEAELFLALNDSKMVSAVSKFKASVCAGYEMQVEINNLLTRRGWKVEQGGKSFSIAAVTALEDVWGGAGEVSAKHGPRLLDLTLHVLEQAWDGDRSSADRRIILGLARVLARYPSAVDTTTMIQKLRRTTPEAIIGKARGASETMNLKVTDTMPMVIVNTYNVGLRKSHIPNWEIRN